MTATVLYKGDLRTVDTHIKSGTTIETDAPVDNKGKGERFSPTDLVAVALGTCIVTTMGIAANTHGIDIDGTSCDVEKIMAATPRRIAGINVNIRFPEGKPYTDKEKSILMHTAETCPVSLSLHPDLKQALTFSWG